MGSAASARAFSSLTAKRATGLCCNIHAGSVVWIQPFSSHASELDKSLLQEAAGVRQLCATPRRSQLAVKWLLIDGQEGDNDGAVLGTHCTSSRMGFEDVMATQSWRRHNRHKTYGQRPDVLADATSMQGARFSFSWPRRLYKLMQTFLNSSAKHQAHPHQPASCKLDFFLKKEEPGLRKFAISLFLTIFGFGENAP